MYDPGVARWLTPDPLAEKIPDYTSYNYVRNNPLLMIDPTGMSDDTTKSETKYERSKRKSAETSVMSRSYCRVKPF